MPQPSVSAPVGPTAMEVDEYRVWRTNGQDLYSFYCCSRLDFPSLTVDWLYPSTAPAAAAAAASKSHRLLLGTDTSDSSPNFLTLASVSFPPSPSDASPPQLLPAVTVDRRSQHNGKVNRARHMTQNPNLVATKTCGPEVRLFDMGKEGKEMSKPKAVLRGHKTVGYAVDWSYPEEGWLISGDYDSKICFWDVGSGILDASQVF